MRIPEYRPSVARGDSQPVRGAQHIGLVPQGCGFPKNVICGAAVAACLATPNPVACILALAPHCLDCLP
jgi:hypothetical protein